MYKFLQISITFLFLFCIANVANAAILYLEPSSGSFHKDDIFLVEVRLDTEGEIINAVRASLEFPPDILKVEDFSKGNSVLTLWPQEPVFGRETGLISFSGGVPGGYWGKDGLLGKIVFQVHKTTQIGTQKDTKLNFLEDSTVLLNDGLGTEADLNKIGATLNILPGTGEEKNPWQEEIDKDDILPEPFKIELSQSPSIFEGKYFIVFSTVDKQTGIDHYEVLEWKKEEWKIATSPYVLENQKLTSDIKVKAIDKAGNYWMEVLEAQKKPGENYLTYVGLGLILVLLVIILWLIIRRKVKT